MLEEPKWKNSFSSGIENKDHEKVITELAMIEEEFAV